MLVTLPSSIVSGATMRMPSCLFITQRPALSHPWKVQTSVACGQASRMRRWSANEPRLWASPSRAERGAPLPGSTAALGEDAQAGRALSPRGTRIAAQTKGGAGTVAGVDILDAVTVVGVVAKAGATFAAVGRFFCISPRLAVVERDPSLWRAPHSPASPAPRAASAREGVGAAAAGHANQEP